MRSNNCTNLSKERHLFQGYCWVLTSFSREGGKDTKSKDTDDGSQVEDFTADSFILKQGKTYVPSQHPGVLIS